MPIPVIDIWEGVNADINIGESGQLTKENFTIWLNRTQLNLLRFLTGDLVDNIVFPMPYEKQKCKDYLKQFITRKLFNNNITIPENYYQWDNLYKLGKVLSDTDCENEDYKIDESCDKQIPILDGQQFKSRCDNWIDEMQPTNGSPICKIVDNKIETEPKDVGSMCLEYIRYPKDVTLVMTTDPNTGEEIVDDVASGSLEWDKWATEYLIWGVVNYHSKRTREQALKVINKSDEPKG